MQRFVPRPTKQRLLKNCLGKDASNKIHQRTPKANEIERKNRVVGDLQENMQQQELSEFEKEIETYAKKSRQSPGV
jgi:hypothetical protein